MSEKQSKDSKTSNNNSERRTRTVKSDSLSPLTKTFAATRSNSGDEHAHTESRTLLQRNSTSTRNPGGGGAGDEILTRTQDVESSSIDLTSVPVVTSKSALIIQPNMTVNTPGDRFEQEAEQTANDVMRMPSNPIFDLGVWVPPASQTGDSMNISRIQASGGGGGSVSPEVETRIEGMKGQGDQLPGSERAFFESRMGYDFSQVRVHTGENAIQASRDVSARAFTFGNNIAFNKGQYRPGAESGRHLLAHELTHVVQQGGASTQRVNTVQRSMVMRHLQMIQRQPGFDRALYRKEIADFQRKNSQSTIRAKQNEILRQAEGVNIRHQDQSQTLRRKGTPATKGKVESGPKYSPSGNITPTASGGMLSAPFTFSATFKHDPANGIDASCCQVRQYIKWTTDDVYPAHPGFGTVGSLPKDTWVEDRDASDLRYGHRSGSHSDPIAGGGDEYTDDSGTQDQANGRHFNGRDTPTVPEASFKGKGKWHFMIKVIDTCNGNKQVGGTDTIKIKW